MARARAADSDLIDGYLEELLRRLTRGMVRNSREREIQVAEEAEDHLLEATAARVAAGMSEPDAQRAAIAAFGTARAVARAHRPRPAAVLATAATTLCALLGTFVLVAAYTGEIYALLCASVAATNPGGTLAGLDAVPPDSSYASGGESLLSRLTAASHDPAGYAASFGVITLIGIALLATRFIAVRRANGGGARVMPLLLYPAAAAGNALFYFGLFYFDSGNVSGALIGSITAGPLGRLQGGGEFLDGVILASEMLFLVYVLWSAVQLIRWIAARVMASRRSVVSA